MACGWPICGSCTCWAERRRPSPLSSLANRFLYASLAGGWIIGLVSVLAGGCVLRQHVLAVQGSRNAWLFLAGFYAAVPLYYLLLARFLGWVYRGKPAVQMGESGR